MKCPLCDAPSDVEQTKPKDGAIWRRRLCYNDHIFHTEERAITEPRHKDDKRRKKAPVQGS
jgi:transcriptional regulator NrdR family protein